MRLKGTEVDSSYSGEWGYVSVDASIGSARREYGPCHGLQLSNAPLNRVTSTVGLVGRLMDNLFINQVGTVWRCTTSCAATCSMSRFHDYTPDAARSLRDQGAQILVSAIAWAPYPHGPEGCWEQRTSETGMALFVCDRTGRDRTLSFTKAESVVVKDGTRLVSFRTGDSSVLLVDWEVTAETVIAWRHEPLEFGW